MESDESDEMPEGLELSSRVNNFEDDSFLMPINTRTLKRRANGQQVIIIDNSQTGDRSTKRREGILALQGNTLVLRNVSSTYIPKPGDEVNLYNANFELERFIYRPKIRSLPIQSE